MSFAAATRPAVSMGLDRVHSYAAGSATNVRVRNRTPISAGNTEPVSLVLVRGLSETRRSIERLESKIATSHHAYGRVHGAHLLDGEHDRRGGASRRLRRSSAAHKCNNSASEFVSKRPRPALAEAAQRKRRKSRSSGIFQASVGGNAWESGQSGKRASAAPICPTADGSRRQREAA